MAWNSSGHTLLHHQFSRCYIILCVFLRSRILWFPISFEIQNWDGGYGRTFELLNHLIRVLRETFYFLWPARKRKLPKLEKDQGSRFYRARWVSQVVSMVPCFLDSEHLSHLGPSVISWGTLGINSEYEPGYQCVPPKIVSILTLAWAIYFHLIFSQSWLV